VLWEVQRPFYNSKFDEFFENSISGRIKEVRRAKTGRFTLEEDGETYYFLQGRGNLYRVAITGDSIYKNAYSDTLYLIKSDTVIILVTRRRDDYGKN
jgi:G3E family GTPase